MATLEELLNSGLGGIIESGGLPTEEALYQRQAQAEQEATFGRGLGISSVTRDALAKARTDAALAAQQAQLAALGQAAGVTSANANRAQQQSQFNTSVGQQNKALAQQKDMANAQMLAGGIGAGVGALGQLGGAAFGPEIRTGARGMFGLGPLRQDAGGGVPGGQTPGAVSPISSTGFSLGGGGGNFNADLASLGGTGSGGGGFEMPDLSGYFDPGQFGGGLNLEDLFDYQPQNWWGGAY